MRGGTRTTRARARRAARGAARLEGADGARRARARATARIPPAAPATPARPCGCRSRRPWACWRPGRSSRLDSEGASRRDAVARRRARRRCRSASRQRRLGSRRQRLPRPSAVSRPPAARRAPSRKPLEPAVVVERGQAELAGRARPRGPGREREAGAGASLAAACRRRKRRHTGRIGKRSRANGPPFKWSSPGARGNDNAKENRSLRRGGAPGCGARRRSRGFGCREVAGEPRSRRGSGCGSRSRRRASAATRKRRAGRARCCCTPTRDAAFLFVGTQLAITQNERESSTTQFKNVGVTVKVNGRRHCRTGATAWRPSTKTARSGVSPSNGLRGAGDGGQPSPAGRQGEVGADAARGRDACPSRTPSIP